MAVIVEFVGLPASGKSTLKSELELALSRQGVPGFAYNSSQPGRGVRRVRSLWRSRLAVLAFARALVTDSRSLEQRIRAFRWLGATLGTYDEAGRGGSLHDVLILGEGVAQRAFLGFLDTQTAEVSPHLAAYLANIPKPHLAVYLKVDPHESVRRQQSRRAVQSEPRKADRLDLPGDRLLAVMQAGDVFLAQLVGALANRHGVEVLGLDTTDLDAAIADLKDRVVPAVMHRSQAMP